MQRFRDQPLREHRLQRALVLAEPIRQRAIELQPVAVGAHAAVAQQVARVLMAEQVLPSRHRAGIEIGERRLQLVVERIARLLVPEQRIVAQHLGIGDRGFEIEAPVGIDRKLRILADLGEHRFDTARDPRRGSRRRSSSSRRCSRAAR